MEATISGRDQGSCFAALDAINSNYEKHCHAAREIAHEYFDAGEVLRDLLQRIGLEPMPAKSSMLAEVRT